MSNNKAKLRLITHKMCPFAQKAWLALECANLDYELQEISLYGPNGKPDWFWQLNPEGTVPVLVQGQQVWPDSDLILQAVAEGQVGTNPLVVADSNKKKRVQSWRKAVNELLPVGKQAVLGNAKDQLAQQLQESLERRMPENTLFLTGDTISVADCHAFPFLWRLDQEFDLRLNLKCPKLAAWVQHCSQLPSFRTTLQPSWWWWW